MNTSDNKDWKKDEDYEEYEIEDVELVGGSWEVSLEFSLRVFWARAPGLPQPRKGRILRLFGMSTYTEPRGMVLMDKDEATGKLIFYRSDEDNKVYLVDQERAQAEVRAEVYKRNKDELSARLEALPKALRNRILRLCHDHADPEWWRAAHLAAEIEVSEHAWRVSLLIPDSEQMEIFLSLPDPAKLASVYGQMVTPTSEQNENDIDPRLLGTKWNMNLTRAQMEVVRTLSILLVDPDPREEVLHEVPTGTPIQSADDLIALLNIESE